MDNTQLVSKIDVLEKKIDALTRSAETIRKIFLWTGIITVALFVLPLIGLVFAIPSFLSNYDAVLQM